MAPEDSGSRPDINPVSCSSAPVYFGEPGGPCGCLLIPATETTRAEALAAELEALKAAAASGSEVVLQKVASCSQEAISDTLDALIAMSYLDESQREKMAATLAADPDAALRLAAHVAQLSVPGHEEGRGLPKAASATPTAHDEWATVLEEGA